MLCKPGDIEKKGIEVTHIKSHLNVPNAVKDLLKVCIKY